MVSSLARAAINAQNTSEVFLTLLQLSHPSFGATLRFVNDLQDVTSNGNTYISYPFQISFPSMGEDNLPTLTLSIDNVDQDIWNAIKPIQTPIDVQLSWVLRSSPDTIEGGPFFMVLKSVDVSQFNISGQLAYEDLMNEPFPRESYIPTLSPGLF